MKFYMREPDAAIAGMAELTFEQIGFYNLVLDLLYSRDGVVPNDDTKLAQMLQRDPRLVRRLKHELMTASKLHATLDGLLTANRVDETRRSASAVSEQQRRRVNVRWDNYRKKSVLLDLPEISQMSDRSPTHVSGELFENHSKNNGGALQPGNTTTITSKKERNSSTSSTAGASPPGTPEPLASVVARNGSSSGGGSELPVTAALEKSLRQKGWI